MNAAQSNTHETAHRVGIVAAVLLGSVGALTLFLFNPAEATFYPRCFFKLFTGLDCPGCGGLRAAHQLLHGNIAAAFALNPLLICLLPLAGWFVLCAGAKKFCGRRLPQPFKQAHWVWTLGVAVIAFGVLRNIPLREWLGS